MAPTDSSWRQEDATGSLWRWYVLTLLAAIFIAAQILIPFKTVWLSIAEYLHISSWVLLTEILFATRSLAGLSVKTLGLFTAVYLLRYADIFVVYISIWHTTLKLVYLMFSTVVLVVCFFLRSSYESQKDTCSLIVLVVPSVAFGMAFSAHFLPLEVMWTVSQYLQGFAMLPQYVFCYRDGGNRSPLLLGYIGLLGGYRIFYGVNWIVRYRREGMFTINSWLSLFINLIFLFDFLLFKIFERSFISSFVLTIDDGINSLSSSLLPLTTPFAAHYEPLGVVGLPIGGGGGGGGGDSGASESDEDESFSPLELSEGVREVCLT